MTIKDLKDNWPIVTFLVAFIGASSVIPFKIQALEKSDSEQSDQLKLLTDIAQEQRIKNELEEERSKILKKAPKGFKWDDEKEEWVKK